MGTAKWPVSNLRKNLFRVVIVLVLVAAMMPLVGATSYAWWVPETLNAMIKAGRPAAGGLLGQGLFEQVLPFAATELGVTWRGEGPPPKVRTSKDGVVWSDWTQPVESEDMFDPSTGTHYSELLDGGRARWAQIGSASNVQSGSLALAVINSKDGPLRLVRATKTAFAAAAQPNIISRRAWGADESIRKGQPAFAPVRKIFVHHTVTPNNADPAAAIRSIYAYHVRVRGWEDIGYNFLVDSQGNVYEGRYSGSSGHPGEDSSGRGVVGAHTENHNAGSTGIALLGNAETQAPSKAAVDALVDVIGWKAVRHNVDPTGSDSSPSGSYPNVAGHRDAPTASTECPGARLHPMLPSIRERAKRIFDASRGSAGGPLSEPLRPILNGPAPGLGDSVADTLRGLGL